MITETLRASITTESNGKFTLLISSKLPGTPPLDVNCQNLDWSIKVNVFISYAREDASQATRLYEDLLSIPNVVPWLDSKNLLPGSRWKHEIMRALKRSDLFVILLSLHSVSKTGFVQKEIGEALDKLSHFPPDQIYLIPARIEECQPKHPEFSELQWVDLFPDWNNGVDLIAKVIKNLTTPTKLESLTLSSADDPDLVVETIVSQAVLVSRLRKQEDLKGCDAMELTVTNVSLAKRNLSGSSFVRCIFTDCNFSNCNLRGVNFEGAEFRKCRLAGADLWGANFWGADIRGIVDFEKSKLECTNFFLTQLSTSQEAVLSQASNSLSLGDYGSFVAYFRDQMGLDEQSLAATFLWLNHGYFRRMFDSHGVIISKADFLG